MAGGGRQGRYEYSRGQKSWEWLEGGPFNLVRIEKEREADIFFQNGLAPRLSTKKRERGTSSWPFGYVRTSIYVCAQKMLLKSFTPTFSKKKF